MQKFFLSAIILLLTGFMPAFTQIIPFDNYTVKEELERKQLPATYIADIEQDHLGYLWLATQVGVIKYDGYNFKEYTIRNGLPDNSVRDILVDSKNRIWLGTEVGGLAVLENEKLTVYNQENGLVSNYSIEILEDKSGNIWYFSYEGVSLIRPDTIINFNAENSGIEQIFASYLGMDGKVWFSTINSLFYYDTEIHKYTIPSMDKWTIYDLCEDKPNSLWLSTHYPGVIHITEDDVVTYGASSQLGSEVSLCIQAIGPDTVIATTSSPKGGIYRIIQGKVESTWEEGLESFYFTQILADRRNRIWINTLSDGIILIENNILTRITTDNNLVSNHPTKTLEDKNGNIWIATSNGLSKYGKVVFQVFRDGLLGNEKGIQSIAAINNSIYLGTIFGLNILKDGKVIQQIDPQEGPFPAQYTDVYSILNENDQVQWLASFAGISRLKDNKIRFVSFGKDLKSEEDPIATDLLIYRDKIFCATDVGLISYDRNKFTLFTVENGLCDNGIWSIGLDPSGNIWCATVNGLSIFDGIHFHNYSTKDGLADNICNDIAFDKAGKAWVATDKGVSEISLHDDWTITCRNIDASSGLRSDATLLVLIDKKGYVWIGHTKGLDRINPASFEIANYGALEGFLPVETNLGAATTTLGNDLWFGTVSGAVQYIPENDIVNTDPPKIYIDTLFLYQDTTNLLSYSEGVDPKTGLPVNLSLPHNKYNLVFKYVGLHYTIIEKNTYKYMLEGFDDGWSETTTDISTPPYRRIPPGKYSFKVMAANCDGVWTKEPAVFNFEIRPPFWKTWWFYTLEVVSAIALLVLYIRLRERKLRQDKIILTQKVKERTIEIEKQRDQIAYQKKEITDSIYYAERIQSAVLPKSEYVDKLLHDYFILFKPRDIVSGDFYWIHGRDGRVIVVAADCTGHGVPGAFMSMLGVSILNELASAPESMTSDGILNILREHLTKTLRQTGKDEDAKDGMDLALCILDTKKMVVQFSGAYNPLVHIRKGECEVYKGDKMPVGIHLGDMKPFTAQEIKLEKGDCLYMFSDGYADQFGGPEGKKFKTANLRELLIDIYYLPMEEQKSKLNETIEVWKGINEQVDDILVVGIRI